jgi:muscleblind protein
LLDTLPVCRDFKQGHCERANCRYVHLLEEYVEVSEGKVTVCRDFAKGKCSRLMCKYYHVPVSPGSALMYRLLTDAPSQASTLLMPFPNSTQSVNG